MANKPHKHAALIKAWADGAEIEYWSPTWEQWRYVKEPAWMLDTEYRIKYAGRDSCWANLKLILDGETGKLKSAEVIND